MIQTREFALTRAEYRRFLRRALLRRSARAIALAWFLVAALMLYLGDLGSSRGLARTLGSWWPLLAILAGWTLWLWLWLPYRMARAPASVAALRARRVRFDADGLEIDAADGTHLRTGYATIEGVTSDDDFVLIRHDSGAVSPIPHHAFADPGDRDAALAMVEAGRAGGTDGVDGAAPATSRQGGLVSGLRRNLAAGLRMLGLRGPTASDLAVSADQLVLLSIVSFVVAICGEYLSMAGEVEYNSFGFASHATSLLLLLAALYLTARLLQRPARFLTLAIAILSLDPWFTVLRYLAEGAANHGVDGAQMLQFAVFVWYVAAWARVVWRVFDEHGGSVAVALTSLFLVVMVPASQLPDEPFWYERYDDSGLPDINVEDVFYRQQGMVDAVTAALDEQRPGVIDLYHLGFGSDANQRVFRREVAQVQRVLDERFDTAGRSMTLVNAGDTVDETPIASASNLALALRGIARKMDREEDVLLLYLTSHGSSNGELAVDFWPLDLNPLSARRLRRMLDEAEIRWRVIVVSACYSGSFINALKDEHTVVITAAASNRTSFGCSNDNEFTYFGDAYFKQALSQTWSFIEGYRLAKELVTRREQAEHLEPSEPRLFVGAQAEAHLEQLAARLAAVRDGRG